MLILPVVGYLTYQLAESSREQARKYQAAAEQLSGANRSLQEAEAAVRRSERLAALGQLIGRPGARTAQSAGHHENIGGDAGEAASMADNEVAREMAGFISSEVDRTNSLVTRFLDFARPLAVCGGAADLRRRSTAPSTKSSATGRPSTW